MDLFETVNFQSTLIIVEKPPLDPELFHLKNRLTTFWYRRSQLLINC